MVVIAISQSLPAEIKSKATKKFQQVQNKSFDLNQDLSWFKYPSNKNDGALIKIKCPTHKKVEVCLVQVYLRRIHGMLCCSRGVETDPLKKPVPSKPIINTLSLRAPDFNATQEEALLPYEKLKKLLQKRGHKCLECDVGVSAVDTKLKIYCPKHNEILYSNYGNSRVKWGIPCCSNEAKSESALRNNLIKNKRDKHAKRDLRVWKKEVFLKTGAIACSITGLLYHQELYKKDSTQLIKGEVHHCYGFSQYPFLNFVPENGVMLSKELHIAYHRFQGGSTRCIDITPNDLINFLELVVNDLSSLHTTLINICKKYTLTEWLCALQSVNVEDLDKTLLLTLPIKKIKSVWSKKPNVNNLFSFVQRNALNLINELKNRDELLSSYLKDPELIPKEYRNHNYIPLKGNEEE